MNHGRRKDGTPITDADAEAMADEAVVKAPTIGPDRAVEVLHDRGPAIVHRGEMTKEDAERRLPG